MHDRDKRAILVRVLDNLTCRAMRLMGPLPAWMLCLDDPREQLASLDSFVVEAGVKLVP